MENQDKNHIADTPENSLQKPEEPMADAMAFSSTAKKERREEAEQKLEEQRRREEEEKRRQEEEKCRKALQEKQEREAREKKAQEERKQREEQEKHRQELQEKQDHEAREKAEREEKERQEALQKKQQQEEEERAREREQAEEEREQKKEQEERVRQEAKESAATEKQKKHEEKKNRRKKKKEEMSLRKQDKLRRRNKKETAEEEDPYYGLKLKSREEYQKEYEETLSFKPIRPEEDSEKTGTFTYLFDKDDTGIDPAMREKLKNLHEKRRRRVNEVVKETGTNDVAKEDIYSITTAISLDDIRKEAAKKGVDISQQPIPLEEPQKPRERPRKEEDKPSIQDPQERPLPMQAVQNPQIDAHLPEGEKTTYRPTGTPVHIVPLNDLTTPVFNESRAYPRVSRSAPKEEKMPRKEERASRPVIAAPAAEKQEETAIPVSRPVVPAKVPDRFADAAVPIDKTDVKEKPLKKKASGRPIVQLTEKSAPADQPQEPVKEAELPKKKSSSRTPVQPDKKIQEPQHRTPPVEKPAARKPQPLHIAGRPEELDDYNAPEDAAAIFHQLGGALRELALRLSITGICSVLELIFGVMGKFGILGTSALGTTVYLLSSLVFLAVAVAFCGVTVFGGLKALVRLRANADSGVAVASIVGLIQGVYSLFAQNAFGKGQLYLYTVVVCAALFLNTLGKLLMVRRVNKNFHYITSPGKKYAVEKFDDHNTALQMAEGVTIDTPEIACQRETGFLKNFLRLSYSDDPSDRSSQFLAPVLFCASLILFLLMLLFIQPGDVGSALTAFAAATCASIPLMNMLSVNLPLSRVSHVATQCGGMIIGFPAVQYFSGANAVLVDAKDLFPRGSIVLNGIKTFRGQQMDSAIIDAAALLQAAGGPLSSLFSQITRSQMAGAPKVENIQYEDGLGISGWVGGRRVLIGSRKLLSHHNVTPSSEELEKKYMKGGRQVVYLSVSGELSAMFIITYKADRHRSQELQRMEDNGISLIVRSNDPNVTAPFLAALFGLDTHTVRVLPDRLGQVYESMEKQPKKEANALIATRGRTTTMMRLVTACVRQRSNISLAVVLQNVSAVLGFVLVAFLCWQKGMQQVSTLGIFIYEAFWCLAIWLVPKLRKP
ncbi:hypothetical protein [Caproicibacterium lactatifermentans]|jgi:cation transport ATPase|uniref:Uncharacterized protein n=1 Tax=Caproicibacterium lactatifermentans TaxID=2666138 RepID=A0ABX6PW89_9FIRM|nr:hypothetical protein [Caproicibacterium lactatifermentans]QKO30311.1 hypothetical protein GKP14_04350 [Caproicibacterium lactatifermentans]